MRVFTENRLKIGRFTRSRLAEAVIEAANRRDTMAFSL